MTSSDLGNKHVLGLGLTEYDLRIVPVSHDRVAERDV